MALCGPSPCLPRKRDTGEDSRIANWGVVSVWRDQRETMMPSTYPWCFQVSGCFSIHGLTQSYWLLTPACRADSPGSVTPNRWGNRDSERVFDSEDGVRVEIFFSD